MRIRLAAIICLCFLFSGCGNGGASLDKAILLRNSILNSNGCSFQTTITADYGEKIYIFSMDCTADKDGNLAFTVTEPGTIAGITGKITATGGAITFDDQVLAFQTVADGQLSPVAAPWLLVKTLRSGYLKDVAANDTGLQISIDDSYDDDALQLQIRTDGQSPVFGEVFWNGRRVLTLAVENFTIL